VFQILAQKEKSFSRDQRKVSRREEKGGACLLSLERWELKTRARKKAGEDVKKKDRLLSAGHKITLMIWGWKGDEPARNLVQARGQI